MFKISSPFPTPNYCKKCSLYSINFTYMDNTHLYIVTTYNHIWMWPYTVTNLNVTILTYLRFLTSQRIQANQDNQSPYCIVIPSIIFNVYTNGQTLNYFRVLYYMETIININFNHQNFNGICNNQQETFSSLRF